MSLDCSNLDHIEESFKLFFSFKNIHQWSNTNMGEGREKPNKKNCYQTYFGCTLPSTLYRSSCKHWSRATQKTNKQERPWGGMTDEATTIYPCPATCPAPLPWHSQWPSSTVRQASPDLCQEPPPSLSLCLSICAASLLVKRLLFHYMSMDQKLFPDHNP